MTNSDPVAALISLLNTPEAVSEVPVERVLDLLAQLRGLEVRLLARLLAPEAGRSKRESRVEPERLLSASEAAVRLSVTVRWIYRHATNLPFTRRLSRKALRFSEQGLQRYIATRNR